MSYVISFILGLVILLIIAGPVVWWIRGGRTDNPMSMRYSSSCLSDLENIAVNLQKRGWTVDKPIYVHRFGYAIDLVPPTPESIAEANQWDKLVHTLRGENQ